MCRLGVLRLSARLRIIRPLNMPAKDERIAQNGVERGAGAVSSFTEDAYE